MKNIKDIKAGIIIDGSIYEAILIKDCKFPCELCAFSEECGDCAVSKYSNFCQDFDSYLGADGNYKNVIFNKI